MTPWDDDKSTAVDPDNPDADEQLTADEWDAHVSEGHFPADELNLGVDGGDPVLTDAQNAGEVVLRYDRSAGSWVMDSLDTEQADIAKLGQIELEEASDISGSRSLGQEYTNTTGHTVLLSVYYIDTSVGSDGENHRLQIRVGQSGGFGSTDTVDGDSGRGDSGDRIDLVVSAIVPPGYVYVVNPGGDATGSNVIDWTERRFIR